MKREKFAATDEKYQSAVNLSFQYRLTESIEKCHSIGAVAEKADTYAFPIATSHGEGIASWEIGLAISAVEVLVAVLLAVVGNLEVETGKGAWLDKPAKAVLFDEYAVFAETDACEQLARAKETGIAVAGSFDDGGALALVANDLLGEHIAAGF